MTADARLTVNEADPTPPYEQVRRQVAGLIAAGVLAPGERLPPLRQLAGDLRLAVGTVARAYRELEAAGLVQSRRGGGTRVSDTPPGAASSHSPERGTTDALATLAETYVRQALALGVAPQALTAAVEVALGHLVAVGDPPGGALPT